MNPTVKKILLWLPRILGILFVLFTGLFSFDVFDMGLSPLQALGALFLHLLVPTILLAVVVALAWRWKWVGAAGFGLWAAYYVFQFPGADTTGYVLMTGIPLLIALLYLVDWIANK